MAPHRSAYARGTNACCAERSVACSRRRGKRRDARRCVCARVLPTSKLNETVVHIRCTCTTVGREATKRRWQQRQQQQQQQRDQTERATDARVWLIETDRRTERRRQHMRKYATVDDDCSVPHSVHADVTVRVAPADSYTEISCRKHCMATADDSVVLCCTKRHSKTC